MTKPKYNSPEERREAASKAARAQMLAQWERQREGSGTDLGYFGCHRRVRKTRGRAGDQVCAHCGKQARHWAHVHDTDPADPQNYLPLCQGCHWAYDGVGQKTLSAKSPETRHAVAVKAWATKRRKQLGAQDRGGR